MYILERDFLKATGGLQTSHLTMWHILDQGLQPTQDLSESQNATVESGNTCLSESFMAFAYIS